MSRLKIEEELLKHQDLGLVISPAGHGYQGFYAATMTPSGSTFNSSKAIKPNDDLIKEVLTDFDERNEFDSCQILSGHSEKTNQEINKLISNFSIPEIGGFGTYAAFYTKKEENQNQFIFEVGVRPDSIDAYLMHKQDAKSLPFPQILIYRHSLIGFAQAYNNKTKGFFKENN